MLRFESLDFSLKSFRKFFLFAALFTQWQCSSNIYEVRFIVKGLDGTLVLQNNGEDDTTVKSNGPFSFDKKLGSGDSYLVTVLTQPDGQVCSVTDGEGTIGNTHSAYIEVNCVDGFTVGGTISGQTGALKLTNNGSEEITLAADATTFTFTTALLDGAAYDVTVSQQPSGQTCAVTGGDDGTGGGSISGAHDNSIVVTCSNVAALGKRIFVTAATYDGATMAGVAGADAHCMADTNKPSTGTYKAMIADQTNRISCVNAMCSPTDPTDGTDWVFQPSTAYYQSDGTTLIGTTTTTRLFTFNVANGFSNTATEFWTGIGSNWGSIGANCTKWTATTAVTSRFGTANAVDSTLISSGGSAVACTTARAIACVEQ